MFGREKQASQQPRICMACSTEKDPTDYPQYVTERCVHTSDCCKGCLQTWVAAQLETKGWDHIKCPQCTKILQKQEMAQAASEAVFER